MVIISYNLSNCLCFLYIVGVFMQSWLCLILLTFHQCLHGCPLEAHSSCRCQYSDIICTNSNTVPHFVADSTIYRAINLNRQNIYEIRTAAFYHLHVRRIDLNFNPIGFNLDVNAFAGVESVLERLSLGNCSLPYLRSGLLIGMNNLLVLQLWNNHIDTIPAGFFRSSTPQLEELELWGNHISQLNDNTFLGLSRLRRLDLDRNRIKEISRNMFQHFPKLESLYLGENNIVSIYADTFKDLPNLRLLNLDRNGLMFMLPNAFSGLRNLLSLGLQHNQIGFIQDHVFNELRNVVALHLHSNNIEFIWTKTFTGLDAVKHLALGDNKIKNLPNGVFYKCPRLTKLCLDDNHIRELHRCIISNPRRLKRLSILSNPMKCDCNLSWLQDLHDNGASVWGLCNTKSSHMSTILTVTNPLVYRTEQCPYVSSYCNV